MPDHVHFLLKVPDRGSISKVVAAYKRAAIFNIGCPSFWQPRFHIRLIANPHLALRYIYTNPVKAGLCEDENGYPWSSASGKWDVCPLDIE